MMHSSKTIPLLLLFISPTAYSLGFRHMVTFGSQGLGWSGATEQMQTKSDSNFKRVDYYYSNLGLNYAYLINSRFQIGGFFQTMHQEHQFHRKGSGAKPTEIETNNFGFFTLYNFSDTLTDAYYTGAGVSIFYYKEENSHDLEESEGKSPFELDDQGVTLEVVFGKRFNLKHWNIEHLTYSPQGGFFHRTHGKDFNDQKVADGIGVSLQPVKFDFLF